MRQSLFFDFSFVIFRFFDTPLVSYVRGFQVVLKSITSDYRTQIKEKSSQAMMPDFSRG